MSKYEKRKKAEEKGSSSTLKKSIAIAGSLGIGYVGIKSLQNPNSLLRSGLGKLDDVARHGVEVTGQNPLTKEIKNVSKGVVDTFGEDPGLLRLLKNTGRVTDGTLDNKIRLAKESARNVSKPLPRDVKKMHKAMSKSRQIKGVAREAQMKFSFEEILRKGSPKNITETDINVILRATKDRSGQSAFKRDFDIFDVKKFLSEIQDADTNYRMGGFQQNKEGYADDLYLALKKANEKADDSVRQYELFKAKKIKELDFQKNLYASQAVQMEALEFQSAYEASKKAEISARIKNQRTNGFEPITYKEASSVPLKSGQTIDEQYAIRRGQERVSTVQRFYQEGENWGYKQEELENHIFSNQIFINRETNEIRDFTTRDAILKGQRNYLQDTFQVPFMKFNPFDILQTRTFDAIKEAPSFQIFQAGETLDFLDTDKLPTIESPFLANYRSNSKPIAENLVFSGDTIYRLDNTLVRNASSLKDVNEAIQAHKKSLIVESDLTLAPTYGNIFERMAKGINGASPEFSGAESFKDFFGFGQEEETLVEKGKRFFNKFTHDEYGANLKNHLFEYPVDNEADMANMKRYFNKAEKLFQYQTGGLSAEAENELNTRFTHSILQRYQLEDFDFDKLNTPEAISDAVMRLSDTIKAQRNGKPSSIEEGVIANLEGRLMQMAEGFNQVPTEVFEQSRSNYHASMLDNVPQFLGGPAIETFSEMTPKKISATKDAKRLMQELALATASGDNGELLTIGEVMNGLLSKDSLSVHTQKELMNLNHHAKMSYFNDTLSDNSFGSMLEKYQNFQAYYSRDPGQMYDLKASIQEVDGFWGYGPSTKEKRNVLGDTASYTPIKKHRKLIQSLNNQYTETENLSQSQLQNYLLGALDYAEQFVGGAKNKGNITTSTALPYFFADRLDTALTPLGLGLPNHMKGSASSILMNQFGRRIVLPYVAYEGLKFADGLTGDTASDSLANAYVNMRQDVATLRDNVGLTRINKKTKDLLPYSEQFSLTPLGKATDFLTFGLFNSRNQEEELRYWESGEDPIRKGRNWGIGSNSPYIGSKIDRYEPNWYRKIKSDYKFSENMYGSEFEYWFNHPVANPLVHFVLDPYHYERKHKESRPYAVTGGFAELQAIPLVGPVVDSAVSSILKPRHVNKKLKDAHKAYLRDYNERLAEDGLEMNAPGRVALTSSGGINFNGMSVHANVFDEEGEVDTDTLEDYASAPVRGAGLFGLKQVGTEVYEDYVGAIAQMSISDQNTMQRFMNAISGRPVNMRESIRRMNQNLASASTISKRSNLSNPGSIIDYSLVTDLSQVKDKNALLNPTGPYRDVLYNASEMAGIFGFVSKSALGWEETRSEPVLQSSGDFASYNRLFWDGEFGGLGGDLSEIFRRYLPRNTAKETYNPIRNTMPTWMPGPEYFKDFLHGDPYSKIAHGEMRLPGEAYEKLYNVKKDKNGNYSAFDRYRILADVAPYSDQYRFAKKEVSLLSQEGELSESQREEYAEIREQVKNKKKKHLTYNTRFIEDKLKTTKETVTVTRVIDANTFLTKEYGNNPLKLAGVGVRADDKERTAILAEMIRAGQKIEVELDADPSTRIRNDLMNTMRAVVYTPHSYRPEGANLLRGEVISKGENLNYLLANMNGGQGVTVREDGSAVATKALYDKTELTIGKVSELITHKLLPNIPVVNVIADKFLNVNSPVEAYRKNLYSLAWRDWKHPLRDWVKPMLDTNHARNPMLASAFGYATGRLFTRRYGTYFGLAVGATSGIFASGRAFHDFFQEDTARWIPKRREEERDLDEYFDKLKYVKFKGLYEQSKSLAKKYEGIDLDEKLRLLDIRGKKTKGYKKYLQNKKKRLSINKKSGYGNEELTEFQLKAVNNNLALIDNERVIENVGYYTSMALRYKDEMESTLYGAEDNMDFQKIYKALPAKDRQFFTEFLKASPSEKQEIIRLVPKNQRRIYQKMFNMDLDEKEDLKDYFKERYLPSSSWEGWRAGNSLDSIKVKVMQNQGMTLTESNYWSDDVKQAEASQFEAIEPNRVSFAQSIDPLRLEKLLKGIGVEDVSVSMQITPSKTPAFQTNFSIQKNREEEIKQGILNQILFN